MKLLLLFVLILFSLAALAQKTTIGLVTGKVIEASTKQPVPYASVGLKNQAAKIITGVITNEKGEFKLTNVPVGTYTLEINFIGFTSIAKTITLSLPHPKIDLGTLLLQPDAANLKEVLVTGEKSNVILKLDKKVFLVGKDILAQSGSANEVLNNVPSVTVSPTGVVSLRGNSNVHILINGRRSGLTLSNALDQTPADNIEQVEVITNPSSRYDASGSAGIINIILKRNKKSGFNGQVRLVAGSPLDVRLNPSINYKSAKLNVFSTFGYRQTDYVGNYASSQNTIEQGIFTSLNRSQIENRHDDGKLLYLGADYFINAYNTLTAAYFKNATIDTDGTTLHYYYSDLNYLNPDSTFVRTGKSKEIRDYNQLEFNYTKTYPIAGQKFTVDMQYDYWNSNKTWQLRTQKILPVTENSSGLRTNSVGASKDFLLQTDFIKPLQDKTTLELGLKVENRLVTSQFKAENYTTDAWQIIDTINNVLDYNEQIGSAYIQFGSKIKKVSYLVGLRNEFTFIQIKDRENTFTRNKNYNRLFPTVNISYSIKEEATTQLNYSKRLNRPSLSLLYPFNELTDFNAQFIGNPDLNPSYTDVLEWSFLRNWQKFTLNPSLYYQQTTNFIQFYTFRNNHAVFITSPVNLEKETRYGLELAATYQPLKWLQLNGEGNFYNFRQRGVYQEQNFAFIAHTWNARVSSQLKLPRQFTFQSRYNFTGAQNNAQSLTRALYYVDAAISKNLFSEKATLVLDGSNVFNSRQSRITTTGDNFTFSQILNYSAARYRLSFVYRFNKKEGQEARQAKSGNRQ